MASRKKAIPLDVDPTILENNLLITDPDGGLGSLFPTSTGPQSKVVGLIPGMCIKLRLATEDHGKVFINLCHTKEIPEPEDISEERLLQLWNADNETCEYRVPLSIGERREEPDKSGRPSDVYDVAVNTTFFGKVETSNIFRMFIIDVVMQGLEEKFHIELEKEDYVILKNRTAMGTIPGHRVRVGGQRPGGPGVTGLSRPGESAPATPLVQELGTRYLQPATPQTKTTSRSPLEPVPAAGTATQPDFRLVRQPAAGPVRALVAQIALPSVVSARDVTLDVGEDRLVLSGGPTATKYHADIFLPHSVVQKCTTAKFDAAAKVLTVTLPVEQAV